MSTNAMKMMKKWSLLGVLAIASSVGGCAAESAENDDELLTNDYSVEIAEGDAKADGSDITRLQHKFNNGAAIRNGFKFLNLKTDRKFEAVINTGANEGHGTLVTGTYAAKDDPYLSDAGEFRHLILTVTVRSSLPESTLLNTNRSWEIEMKKSDWGQADSIKFRWIKNITIDPDTGHVGATVGTLQTLATCTDCKLADYDPAARNDDNTYRIRVTRAAVKKYADDAEFPTAWDSGSNPAPAADPKVCIAGNCTESCVDKSTCIADDFGGLAGNIIFATGAQLRSGVTLAVYDADTLGDDLIGEKRVFVSNEQLDVFGVELQARSFGRVDDCRFTVEKFTR